MNQLTDKVTRLNKIDGGKSELQELRAIVERLSRGGNGSGGGGMEARLAKLESSVSYIEKSLSETRSDLRDVRDRTIRLEEKIDHLPNKGFIVSVVLTSFALLTGLIVFQQKIQSLISTL